MVDSRVAEGLGLCLAAKTLESANVVESECRHFLRGFLHLLDTRTEVAQPALGLQHLIGVFDRLLRRGQVEEHSVDTLGGDFIVQEEAVREHITVRLGDVVRHAELYEVFLPFFGSELVELVREKMTVWKKSAGHRHGKTAGAGSRLDDALVRPEAEARYDHCDVRSVEDLRACVERLSVKITVRPENVHKSCGDVNLSAKVNFVNDAIVGKLAVWRLERAAVSNHLLSEVAVLVHKHS
jgi:hypothetical protein